MGRVIKWLGLGVAILFVVGAGTVMGQLPSRLTTDDPDYVAIENSLRLQLAIEAEAIYTLDDSRLTEVLANDQRGGLHGGDLNYFYLKTVRWFTGNPWLRPEEVGALMTRQAFYAYLRAVRQIYVEAVAAGEIDQPGELGQLPAVQALMQASGFQTAYLPPPRPAVADPVPDYPIESISVKDGLGYMVITFPCAKSELVFAKIDHQWYQIGGYILKHLGCG